MTNETYYDIASDEEKAYLDSYDPKKYQTPAITADTVIAVFNTKLTEVKVLMIKRKNYPYKDCYALPGGFLEYGKENLMEAALRELKEETGFWEIYQLDHFKTYSDPDRDPRMHVISDVYYRDIIGDNYFEKDLIKEFHLKASDDASDLYFITYRDGVFYYKAKTLDNEIQEFQIGRDHIAFDHDIIIDECIRYIKEEIKT